MSYGICFLCSFLCRASNKCISADWNITFCLFSAAFQVKAAEVQGGWLCSVLEQLSSDSFYEGNHTTKASGRLGVTGYTEHLYLLLLLSSVFSEAKPSRRQGVESGDERSEDEERSLQHYFGSSSVFLGQFSAIISFVLHCQWWSYRQRVSFLSKSRNCLWNHPSHTLHSQGWEVFLGQGNNFINLFIFLEIAFDLFQLLWS